MEFSRQEYWSKLLFPSPGDLPNSGIKPRFPTLQAGSLPTEPQGKPRQRTLSFFQIAPAQHCTVGLIHNLFNLSLSSFLKSKLCVCTLSHVRLFATPWTAACQASLSFTISQSLLKLMSIESVMSSNYLVFCRPLLHLPSIFPSIRIFSNESVLPIRWSKYRSFSISPSNKYSGLISFRMDWFDLLAVQGTVESLLQMENLYTAHKNKTWS